MVVFLVETKLVTNKIELIKKRLMFDECVVLEPRSISGGMALLWKGEAGVELINYSTHHISISVVLKELFLILYCIDQYDRYL